MIVQSVRLACSSISASVSPELIDELDRRVRVDLQQISDSFFFWVWVSAIVVAVGCAMEGPEIFHDLWPKRFPRFSGRWVKHIALAGWFFVVLGVAGEGIFESLDHHSSGLLQVFDEVLLADAQRNAGNAQLAANAASDAARTAREQSDAATVSVASTRALANGARQEADSFAQQIVSANKTAADSAKTATAAEQHLAEALRDAAQAEAELNRIRSPRSFTNEAALIAALTPFKGTEYQLNVFQDEEAIQLTQNLDRILGAAGWVRKQPAGMMFGLTYIQVFGENDPAIPACLDTGISLRFHTKRSLATIQATPFASLPKPLQAAVALSSSIPRNISPANDRNVAPGIIDPKPQDESIPMTICVGKKP